MRKLTEHVVEGDSANSQLQIEVQDGPGADGAHHKYAVYGFHTKGNQSADGSCDDETKSLILFQNGPIAEHGVNGLTQEALLAIVIDRLESFQRGPFACQENEFALANCKQALSWLKRRTESRLQRGVEGRNVA